MVRRAHGEAWRATVQHGGAAGRQGKRTLTRLVSTVSKLMRSNSLQKRSGAPGQG